MRGPASEVAIAGPRAPDGPLPTCGRVPLVWFSALRVRLIYLVECPSDTSERGQIKPFVVLCKTKNSQTQRLAKREWLAPDFYSVELAF
jgi:hypothetical protein